MSPLEIASSAERPDRMADAASPASIPSADASPIAIAADRLYRAADLSSLSFRTTAEIEPIDGLVGRQRAADAIGFGRVAADLVAAMDIQTSFKVDLLGMSPRTNGQRRSRSLRLLTYVTGIFRINYRS
jgi:hypothetical protein